MSIKSKNPNAVLGSSVGVVSVVYLIFFWMFAANDSGYYSRANLELSIELFSLIGLLSAGVFLEINTQFFREKRQEDDSLMILDAEEIKPMSLDDKIIFAVNLLNIAIWSTLVIISFLGDMILAAVLGFVYALCWILMTLIVFRDMLKNSK